MNKGWLAAIIPGVIAFMAAAIIIVLLVVKLLWAWTIPDIFPGAVEQGLVAGSISWYTAFKVAIFVTVFAGLAGVRKPRED